MVAITPPDEPCTVSAIFSDPCSPSFEEPWANAAQRDLARLLGGVARATSEGGVSSSSTSSS